MDDCTHNDEVHRGLEGLLATLGQPERYRVDAVLKSGELEVTERVFLRAAAGGELGPFVRKRLSADAGLGGAYEAVFAAQHRGVRLSHIPRILECSRDRDELVVVMEFVEGRTLGELVAEQDGPLARLALARRVFPGVCDAVSELHERLDPPIIHRDLKPSNVIVSEGGVTLIDLGIARAWREGADCDTACFGTRAYAPPEQFGFGQTGVASDVYALGMLLFFCVGGREPQTSDRERGFADSGVPEELREVIVRATRLDPAARYSSARDLRAAFFGAVEPSGRGPGAEGPADGDAAADDAGELDVAEKSPGVTLEPPESWAPRASRPVHGSWLARVPGRVGVVWNVAVLGGLALVLAACVAAFLEPTATVAAYPRWLQAVSYLVLMPLMFAIGGYLVLDRRPLRRRVPALAQLTVRRETRLGLLVILGIFVVWVALLAAAGVG